MDNEQVIDSLDISGLIDDYSYGLNDEYITYQSASDPDVRITFENTMGFDGEGSFKFCEVRGYDHGEETILISADDDNGRIIGREVDVQAFIDEKFPDGFVEMETGDRYTGIDVNEYMPEPVNIDRLMKEMARDPILRDDYTILGGVDSEGNEFINYGNAASPIQRIDIDDEEKLAQVANNSITEEEALAFTVEEIEEINADVMEVIAREEYIPELPDNMEERVAFDFNEGAESGFSYALEHGFIPFELREGFDSDMPKIAQEDVEYIRDTYDYEFGRIFDIDTTKFDTSENGNVRVIENIDYDDLEPYIKSGIEQFPKEAVDTIKAYKEYGDSFEVQGRDFHVTNLVTFEMTLKGDDTLYRNSFMIDDSGMTHGYIIVHDNEGPLDINRFDWVKPLDELPGSWDPFERQDFMDEVYQKMPSFKKDFIAKMDAQFEARKPMQEARLEKFDNDRNAIRNVYNRVEIYREILSGRIAEVEVKLDAKVDEIKHVYEERDNSNLSPEDFKVLDDKYEELKGEFIELYDEYAKITDNNDTSALNNISRGLSNEYYKLEGRYNSQSDSMKVIFDNYVSGGYGEDTIHDSYIKGIINGKRVDMDGRFDLLMNAFSNKRDNIPDDSKADEILSAFDLDDTLGYIDRFLADFVDDYNSKVDTEHQVHFGEDGQLYTEIGFKIEPTMQGKIDEFIRDEEPRDRYDPNEDRMGLEDYKEIKAAEGIEYKLSPLTPDREDMKFLPAIDFFKDGVYKGIDEDQVRSSGKRDPDVKKEDISFRFSGPDERYFKAMCTTIEDHVSEFILPSREELEKEKEVYVKELEAQDALDREKLEDPNALRDGDVYVERIERSEFDENGNRNSNYDSSSKMGNPYGQADRSKSVSISNEKLDELRQEADKEADGDKEKAEKLFEEKKAELTEKLEAIKRDVCHYQDKMAAYDDIPFKLKTQHTFYQGAKLEHDSAIRKYEEIGGAIGKDTFVSKGVSKLEATAGKLDLYGSNIINTMILDKFRDKNAKAEGEETEYSKSRYKDIYKTANGDTVTSYSEFSGKFGKGFATMVGQPISKAFRLLYSTADDVTKGLIRENVMGNDTEKNKDNTTKGEDSKANDVDKNDIDTPRDAQIEIPEDNDNPDNVDNDKDNDTDNPDDDNQDNATQDNEDLNDDDVDKGDDPENEDVETPEENAENDVDNESEDDIEEPEDNRDIDNSEDDDDDKIEVDPEDVENDEDQIDEDEEDKLDKDIEVANESADLEKAQEDKEEADKDNEDKPKEDVANKESDKLEDDKDKESKDDKDKDSKDDKDKSDKDEDRKDKVDEKEDDKSDRDENKDVERDDNSNDTDKDDDKVLATVPDGIDNGDNDDTESKDDTKDVDSQSEDSDNPEDGKTTNGDNLDNGDEKGDDDDVEPPLSREDVDNGNDDTTSKDRDTTPEDAMASADLTTDPESAKAELSEAIDHFIKGEDTMDPALEKLADVVANESLSPVDLHSVLVDAAVEQFTAEGSFDGVADLIAESCYAMDGSPTQNTIDIIEGAAQSLGDNADLLESQIGDALENVTLDVDEMASYNGYDITAEGVFDSVAGSDIDFGDALNDVEANVANEIDLMELDPDADFGSISADMPELVDQDYVDAINEETSFPEFNNDVEDFQQFLPENDFTDYNSADDMEAPYQDNSLDSFMNDINQSALDNPLDDPSLDSNKMNDFEDDFDDQNSDVDMDYDDDASDAIDSIIAAIL